jgi:hypothetical protein
MSLLTFELVAHVLLGSEKRRAGLSDASTIFLAAIKTCTLDDSDSQLRGLDIHFYSSEGTIHVVDITNLQCLVGRIWDRSVWAIVDQSGSLARALYVEDSDD